MQELQTAGSYSISTDARHLSPMMQAAAVGEAERVRRLLEQGAHVNVLDDLIGTTALHLAAQGGHVEVVRLLVDHGAYVNLQAPSHGFTPLMNAVWHRQAEVVAYLLGLDTINVQLTNALGLKARDLIDLFMAGPNIPEEILPQHEEEAARFHRLFEDHISRRERRVADQKIMAAIVNAGGHLTPEQQLAAVEEEIAGGVDVNAVSPVMMSGHDAHTPILAAALLGHAEIVRVLLQAGADPTIGCGYMKANPAHKAASFGHTQVMRVLSAHSSFAGIRDARGPYNGYTPLMDAVWHGHYEAAHVLVEAGADTAVRGHDGKSALDLAREFGYARLEVMMAEARGSRPANEP